ncbi:MAG: FkbM family methyltransferase [Coleofasciculus sp. A1-SPW-01]|uniref:FkbM family methyltransferase n=1 Tax=Coleofasciculus sp. A1-SPW-01 TaxID=3070819 RepID=UPI0032FFD973
MFLRSIKNLFFKFRYRFKGIPFQIANYTLYFDESLRRWNMEVELAVHRILGRHLNPGHVFIDIGANFGLHTLYAAKLVGDKGFVFAFEPVPANLKLLRRNVALSGVQQQVKIVPKAVSNSSEPFVTFYLPPEEVAVTASLCSNPVTYKTIQLSNVRLDDYWSNLDLPVQFIKIDVEGAELEVLRGAENLLKQWHPTLLIEVHGFALPNFGSNVNELRNFLKNIGYQESVLDSDGLCEENYFHALYRTKNY